MTPLEAAIFAGRSYSDPPTVGVADSASVMHVYGNVHCFRGTDNIEGWLHDFDVDTEYVWGMGSVEVGFWSALSDILPGCLALPVPEYIVGHSLGAAMAVLYAGVYAMLGHAIPVYAFEPPRPCGDDDLKALLNRMGTPWYATRNGLDVVTDLPPELSLPGPLTAIGTPTYPFPNVEDHHIDKVIASLRELYSPKPVQASTNGKQKAATPGD